MSDPAVENRLVKIGQIMLDHEYRSHTTILLYSKLERMSVSSAIFCPQASHVDYRDPMNELTWPLLDLWEATPSDKRWAEMEYLICGGRFTVTYTYPNEIDPEEDPLVRRDRVVAKYFGDKPIVYPPWDDSVRQTFTL